MQDLALFGIPVSELTGLVAGTLTTLSFLPQALKTWRTRSAKDISLVMFLCLCVGVALWLAYGLMIGAVPVIVSNLVTLAIAGTILVFKLRYG
ncbi:SemiSWEET transporter [Arenibaculum pallidiluteum]|uniref:SemiSWEET transporter n=1 Tax=Arenibaculum pallidiluteum TaxID=2812559 RepID=UPI001A9707F3|nr:SemiSWEET transporter [Arenibaculum pallidiluteum]